MQEVRDEHWEEGSYHPLDTHVRDEQQVLLRDTLLIKALNRYFGHSEWSYEDVSGQAVEYRPLGEDGPVIVRFRGEDILQMDPPSLRKVLGGHHGTLHWRKRYEFLGPAKRVIN